jgi:hypothetical protein
MVQPVQRAFESIPGNLSEAAAVSGLSAWQTFWRVELPLAWPGVLSACVLTFVHTLGEFGVVLMVGGSIPGETRTIPGPPERGRGNIHLALSLVPEAMIAWWDMFEPMYLKSAEMRDFHREFRAVTHAQIEMLAARTAALNQCIY